MRCELDGHDEYRLSTQIEIDIRNKKKENQVNSMTLTGGESSSKSYTYQ